MDKIKNVSKMCLTFLLTNFVTINNYWLIKFTERIFKFLTEVLSISVESLLLIWEQWLDGLGAMVRIRIRLV